jgi:tetratricopeptide (TPR) repeat protein
VNVPSIIAMIALAGGVLAGLLATQRGLNRVGHLLTIGAPVLAALVFVSSDWAFSRQPTPPSSSAVSSTTTAQGVTATEGTPLSSSPTPSAPPASGPVAELRRTAEDFKRQRRFAEARDTFQKVTRLAPFDPDGWADLADATAAAAGGDLQQAATAIDRALELDSVHPKALWLKASLELQLSHYPAAAEVWRRLLAQLPADSNDARLVRENVEEAERLAKQKGSTR